MTLLAAAGVPGTSTLLAVAALLACFVAGLFARSVLEHELDLWQRHRHPERYQPTGQAHR